MKYTSNACFVFHTHDVLYTVSSATPNSRLRKGHHESQQNFLQRKDINLVQPYFPASILPLVPPRRPAVNTSDGGVSVQALSPPWSKAASVHVCSALGTAPDSVVGAVHFFAADGTLVGEGLAATGMRAGWWWDWTLRSRLKPGDGR